MLFCALLAGLHALRNQPWASPERLRKALHILTGTTAFAFPFLFESAVPVWALVGGILVVLLLRRRKLATQAVGRTSIGELLMPLSIAVLFTLTRGQPLVLYWLPLFYLVFADSLAALVGAQFGRHRYGSKSLEGTATFVGVALLGGLVFLPPATALALAVLASALEHISWRGLDNLTVPIGSYLLLALPQSPLGLAG